MMASESMVRIWLLGLLTLFAAGLAPVGALQPAAWAGMRLDVDTELQLLREGRAQRHIGGANYRFAVFSFDDPDATGLGNAVASILSHDLLMNNKAHSIGVLRYEGGLGKPSGEAQLRYFDKVEPLIESQGVQVAIWGTIRRSGDKLRIDSFTQLSPAAMRSGFTYHFSLSKMGGGRLVHRIAPDRMLTQRLTLSAEDAQSLGAQAARLNLLHDQPGEGARVVGELPVGSVYYLQKRSGDWVQVGMQAGRTGWLRGGGFCTGPCTPLLAVSQFASGLMAYDDSGAMPERSEMLAPDALAFIDQVWAVAILNGVPAEHAYQEVLYRLKPWCPEADAEAAAAAVPPGGAATCNLRAIARLVATIRRGEPSRDLLISVANDLARASLSDPSYVPTLQNLVELFNRLGDIERLKLALRLAKAAEAEQAGQQAQAPPSAEPQGPAQEEQKSAPPEQNIQRAD